MLNTTTQLKEALFTANKLKSINEVNKSTPTMKTIKDIEDQLHRIECLWRFECSSTRYEANHTRYEKACDIMSRYRNNMRKWIDADYNNRKGHPMNGERYGHDVEVPRDEYAHTTTQNTLQ